MDFDFNAIFDHRFDGNFLLAYLTFVIAATTPGIANIAIMTTAMRDGRRAARYMALGVISVSFMWGFLAALGMGVLLGSNIWLARSVSIVGGIYLGWLAYRFAKQAWHDDYSTFIGNDAPANAWKYYAIGLGIHLTNIKSIFAWVSVIAIAIADQTSAMLPFVIALVCWLSAFVIFMSYAYIFSLPAMYDIYRRCARYINAASSIVFIIAALVIFTSAA